LGECGKRSEEARRHGSALEFGDAPIEDGKPAVPPGTIEAFNKYLELAPNGGHASDVHAMLDMLK
jgi:hypothetical protein